jgi:hypothetical protein
LKCHFSVNLTSFHILWLQKLDQRSELFCGAFYQCSSPVKHATVWCSELSSGLYYHVKWLSTIILHGSTTQKTALNIILTTVRTWNLTMLQYYH